jgi:hypothetical protein
MRGFRNSSLAGLLAVCVAMGCSGAEGDAGRVDVYETTGKITLDGKPLADAVVTFSPKGEQPVAIGRTDSSGNYSLRTYEPDDGAAAGDFTVLVSKPASGGSSSMTLEEAHAAATSGESTSPARSHAQAAKNAPKSEVPEKYGVVEQSDLTATVTADGENTFSFDLKK